MDNIKRLISRMATESGYFGEITDENTFILYDDEIKKWLFDDSESEENKNDKDVNENI